MRDVRDGGFCPLMSFCLASLVGRHFAIGRDEVPADDMRADEGFDEPRPRGYWSTIRA
jgi:hypothetical protein